MSKLAIKGGKPVRSPRSRAWPVSGEPERESTGRIIEAGKWGHLYTSLFGRILGSVEELKEAFSAYYGVQYSIPVANGSAALEVALRNAGVGYGDEVITPPTTWVATNLAPVMVGADPVFTDVCPDTYGLDPARIEDGLTPRTKAIIPVHIGGYPCDMEGIMAVARKHGLVVIEDCAQAHGGKLDGKLLGTFGAWGCFSFEITKLMSSGEGGMVIANDAALGESVYGLCGEAGRQYARIFSGSRVNVGWNYRMTEIQAALLLGQMERLDEQKKRRIGNAEYLAGRLREVEGIRPLEQAPEQNYYSYIFRYDRRAFKDVPKTAFMEALVAEGIPLFSSPSHQPPAYRSPSFFSPRRDYRGVSCPVAERAYTEEAVGLPGTWVLLGGRKDMDEIVDAVLKVKDNIDEIAGGPAEQATVP